MTTINISLPVQLKSQAEDLIKKGFYVSFSDLVRSALRDVIDKNKYEILLEETQKDFKKGKAKVLKNSKDVDSYFSLI